MYAHTVLYVHACNSQLPKGSGNKDKNTEIKQPIKTSETAGFKMPQGDVQMRKLVHRLRAENNILVRSVLGVFPCPFSNVRVREEP